MSVRFRIYILVRLLLCLPFKNLSVSDLALLGNFNFLAIVLVAKLLKAHGSLSTRAFPSCLPPGALYGTEGIAKRLRVCSSPESDFMRLP